MVPPFSPFQLTMPAPPFGRQLRERREEIPPESCSSFFSLLKLLLLRGAIRPGGKFTHPRGWAGTWDSGGAYSTGPPGVSGASLAE
jgi:hypothetical protein